MRLMAPSVILAFDGPAFAVGLSMAALSHDMDGGAAIGRENPATSSAQRKALARRPLKRARITSSTPMRGVVSKPNAAVEFSRQPRHIPIRSEIRVGTA